MKQLRSFSLSRPKPYYNFPATSTTRQSSPSRISTLSMSHRNQSNTMHTIDITNQIHKYRDLLDGANDQSIMNFMNTLRDNQMKKKRAITKMPQTFRMLERKSVCESHSKRVSDLSPQPRVSEFYQYWTSRKGSQVKDFVNFGCQLRSERKPSQDKRKPFNYLRTIIPQSNNQIRDESFIHCPKLKSTMKSSR